MQKPEAVYDVLFQPMNINGMRLKNRMIMAPMGTHTPMLDGTESEEGMAYYEARAKGGAAMIQTGAMFLNEWVAQGGVAINFTSILSIPKGTVFVERIHRWGAKLCAQISNGTGRNGMPTMEERVPISASAIPSFHDPSLICREVTKEEIKGFLDAWAQAARNAVKMGFDAIEIHAHAGYLVDQFMTPAWNKRTDEYGGSFENRMRFPTEIIQTIRKEVGPRFPILFRIALDHRFEGGRTLEDSMPILEALEKAGVDAFDIDAGSYESLEYIFPTRYLGEACMAYVCEEARKHVKVPIINAGSHNPETAVELLNSGNADFIQFGRQFIADPDFPNKLKAGKREDVRPCIRCNEECIGRVFKRYTAPSCTVNPSTMVEDYTKIEKLDSPKKVAVVGAGPGGLEAARTAAIRGCDVTVYDKDDKIGGTFGLIAGHASFKGTIRSLIKWYEVQLEKLGVKIELNKEIDPESIELENADEIFIATGSREFLPPIEGLDSSKVIDVVDVHRKGVKGEKVVICGGGMSAMDTAFELYEDGIKDISVIEMRDGIAIDALSLNRLSVLRLANEYGIKCLCNRTVSKISEEGVIVKDPDGKEEMIDADVIITAFGRRPLNDLSDKIQKKYPKKTTLIGDCEKIGLAGNAIREGFYAALALQ